MATSVSAIQQLYVAYFNRPADYFGLTHWQAIADAQGLAYVANEFSKSPEYTAQYAGKSQADSVNQIYLNLFGRPAEADGLVHWVNLLNSGNPAYNMGTIALAIAQGAQNADLVAVNAKVDAAAAFTASLAGNADAIRGYDGAAANAAAVAWLTPVVNAATHDAAISAAGLAAVTADVIQAHNAGTVNSTTNLGGGVDTVNGTVGNDVINALSVDSTGTSKSTLTAFDAIDGGAGVDTLNIYVDDSTTGFNVQLPSSATVKNVENINLFNDTTAGTAFTTDGTVLDASKFVGATTITQIGVEVDVTNLAATTTAGFKSLAAQTLKVTAADAAASATVSLKDVDDASGLTVLGSATGKLGTVTVIGAVVDAGTDGVDAIALNVTVGKDVQTATINSTVDVNLAVTDGAGTKKVTTINAAGSTGSIKTTGSTSVASIATGTGKDDVTLATTLNTTTKAATVTTGEGNDKIALTATGTASAGNTVSADGGAGNDKIAVTVDANIAYTINGGAGNDTVTITSGTVKTTDLIDGGDGVDTIAMAGKASYIADDFLVFTKVLKNFEAIEFTGATAVGAFDASQVPGFKTITFDAVATNTISKVAADQSVVTLGSLDATAVGYSAGAAPVAPAAGSTTTYAGSLTITATADTSAEVAGTPVATTVTAHAQSVALTVQAGSDTTAGDVTTTLAGDVKSAVVTLANGVNSDDSFSIAKLVVVNASTGVGGDGTGAYTALGGMTSLTVTGNGTADITNTTKLTTVDASGLNSVDADGAATTGLVYTSTNTSAETVKLGGGIDNVTLKASTYGGIGATKVDTVTGLNLVLDSTGTLDAAKSDSLSVLDGATAITVFSKGFTTTQTDIDLALKDAATYSAAHGNANLVFQVGGNTYIFAEHTGGTTGALDAADVVVKLTGAVDLDALIQVLA